MFVYILALFIIFLFFLKIAKKSKKGKILESITSLKLQKYEDDGGKVIDNCYLKWRNGTTTQIDNLLITKYGLFVIECKDYGGWIFGTDSQRNWTEVYPYGKHQSKKSSFYNPIKQNENHIKCIRYKIKNNEVPIHNIVVFSNTCVLKNITNHSNAHITKQMHLATVINDIIKESNEVLLPSQINNYYEILKSDVENTKETEYKHIQNVERIKQQKEYEKNYYGNNCPKCGSPLVLRKGKFGEFYGCSSYPKCNYTKK